MKLLWTLPLFAVACSAVGQDDLIEVEAIVFEQGPQFGFGKPYGEFEPLVDVAVDLENLPAYAEFRPLDRAERQLEGIASRLGGTARYRVLEHTGWEQPRRTTRYVLLRDDTLVRDDRRTAPELEGTVWARADDRGAEVRIDLAVRAVVVQESFPGQTSAMVERTSELTSFLLRATRRIEYGEIHYFDHERFGVILSVRAPFLRRDSEAEATDASNTATQG